MSSSDPKKNMLRPRVVIVGAGFGGMQAARALRHAPVDVTVLDRTNHYLFQPLLYQAAAGVLSPADITQPTRFLLRKQRNATVLLSEIMSIDLERKQLAASDGSAYGYDYLIVATGARHSYFGHPEWEAFAPGLKTLEDAREIRHRFLLAFEHAEKSEDPAERAALLTFVIVGAGPTGVELAGILPTIARRGLRRDFRRIDTATARVILLEGGARVLPTFPERLSTRAHRDLEELGVEVQTNTLVTRVGSEGVDVGDHNIPSRTVFWAAGNAASPLMAQMGTPVDRAGRAVVRPDLSISNHPEVFVIGDAATVPLTDISGDGGGENRPAVPGLAAAAMQMGAHAAQMISRSLNGQPRSPFRYRDRGSLAVIGRNRAIADFGRVSLTGFVAFLLWLFIHLLFLASFRNRVSVLLEWTYAYVTYRPGARLIAEDRRPRHPNLDGD